MILVDSSVWIDYFNGNHTPQTDLLDHCLSTIPIIIGDLILTEVLQGFRLDKDYQTAKTFLSHLQFHHIGGYEVALQSAQIYRSLRRKGVTVRKTIDVIIAGYCIVQGLTLLHDDRDFIPIADHFPLKIAGHRGRIGVTK